MTCVMAKPERCGTNRAMTVEEAFARVPFLRALAPEDRQRLLPYAERRVLGKNQRCWVEGQPTGEFVFVLRGSMKLLKASQSGRSTILETTDPGQLICASAVWS